MVCNIFLKYPIPILPSQSSQSLSSGPSIGPQAPTASKPFASTIRAWARTRGWEEFRPFRNRGYVLVLSAHLVFIIQAKFAITNRRLGRYAATSRFAAITHLSVITRLTVISRLTANTRAAITRASISGKPDRIPRNSI